MEKKKFPYQNTLYPWKPTIPFSPVTPLGPWIKNHKMNNFKLRI